MTLQAFDVDRIRNDFPILTQQVHNKPLVYLDNAATSQKPASVIKAEQPVLRAVQLECAPRGSCPC